MSLPKNLESRKKIFMEYLNLVYSSKKYSQVILSELKRSVTNITLMFAIDEAIADSTVQFANMAEMCRSIDEKLVQKRLFVYEALTTEAYKRAVEINTNTLEKDCEIIFYLEVIESIEVVYFKTLMDMGEKLGYNYMNIRFAYDAALDNQRLLYYIHAEMVA